MLELAQNCENKLIIFSQLEKAFCDESGIFNHSCKTFTLTRKIILDSKFQLTANSTPRKKKQHLSPAQSINFFKAFPAMENRLFLTFFCQHWLTCHYWWALLPVAVVGRWWVSPRSCEKNNESQHTHFPHYHGTSMKSRHSTPHNSMIFFIDKKNPPPLILHRFSISHSKFHTISWSLAVIIFLTRQTLFNV